MGVMQVPAVRLRYAQRLFAGMSLLVTAALLQGCGDSSAPAGGADAASASGPPAVDSKGCTVYGDPPRPTVSLSPDGTLNAAIALLANACLTMGGETLKWTDPDGNPRTACMVVPPQASAQKPVPMLVWLHPTLLAQDSILATGLPKLVRTGDLSGDPANPGFILLLPLGRDIKQFLPAPLNTGIGWDHWYRNLDRSSPYLNVDVAAIDYFISVPEQRGIVDTKRVYMSGWSEGADMSTLYGLDTNGIAATGVYSTITPFADPADPCPGPAFATNQRPYYLMVRECDAGDACDLGQQFLNQLRGGVLPAADVSGVILDFATKPVAMCNSACNGSNPAYGSEEQYEHTHWPQPWNDNLLGFMRDNAEP